MNYHDYHVGGETPDRKKEMIAKSITSLAHRIDALRAESQQVVATVEDEALDKLLRAREGQHLQVKHYLDFLEAEPAQQAAWLYERLSQVWETLEKLEQRHNLP